MFAPGDLAFIPAHWLRSYFDSFVHIYIYTCINTHSSEPPAPKAKAKGKGTKAVDAKEAAIWERVPTLFSLLSSI
jgi:hypothetical protein